MNRKIFEIHVKPPLALDVDDHRFRAEKERSDPAQPKILERVLSVNIKAGDTAAFDYIFSAYFRDMVIFAAHYTHESDSAEEIVQKVFVRLWEDRENINVDLSLRAYLLNMIKNSCIDWYRHQKAVKNYKNFVITNAVFFQCDTDNYILHSELEKQLDATLCRMPWEIAEVYRMNRVGCFTYVEIAKKLNISVRTVEVRIGKALHLLRKHLKDYLEAIIGALFLSGSGMI